jgi:hypothetical protein
MTPKWVGPASTFFTHHPDEYLGFIREFKVLRGTPDIEFNIRNATAFRRRGGFLSFDCGVL